MRLFILKIFCYMQLVLLCVFTELDMDMSSHPFNNDNKLHESLKTISNAHAQQLNFELFLNQILTSRRLLSHRRHTHNCFVVLVVHNLNTVAK